MYKIKVLRDWVKMVKGAYSFSSELRLSATAYRIRHILWYGKSKTLKVNKYKCKIRY